MQKAKAKNIDLEMCRRAAQAFTLLRMNFRDIASSAGFPSKSQLIEISNGVMEPSKRIIRYLISQGFSAHWLFTGEGPQYWDQGFGATSRAAVIKRIKGDLVELKETSKNLMKKSGDLQKTLDRLLQAD